MIYCCCEDMVTLVGSVYINRYEKDGQKRSSTEVKVEEIHFSETIMYTPNPIQTDDISLSDDLVALTKLIAANVHDVWAAGRIKEGWTYGKNKDTEKKTTPCADEYFVN